MLVSNSIGLRIAQFVSYLALAGGGVVTARGALLAWDAGTGNALLPAGATVVAAALAGIVASQSVTTWKTQRRLDRELANFKLQQETYTSIAANLVGTFPGGASEELRATRAGASVWASPTTLRSLAEWTGARSRAQRTGTLSRDGTTYAISATASQDLKEKLAAVVVAMRKDLLGSGDDVEPEVILRSIFEDSH